MEILSWQDSLDLLLSTKNLTKSGALIAKKIIEHGRVFTHKFFPNSYAFPIIDVHLFLNHRVEPELIEIIGHDLAQILKPYNPELILTAATSGIAPTQATARHLNNTPYIYARKEASITFSGNSFKAHSFSITGGHKLDLYISQRCLKPKTRVILIDDFLDKAILAKNLFNIVAQAKCYTVAAAFMIEKSENEGRKKLIKRGLSSSRIHSLLKIDRLAQGKIQIAGIPYWLSLKKQ